MNEQIDKALEVLNHTLESADDSILKDAPRAIKIQCLALRLAMAEAIRLLEAAKAESSEIRLSESQAIQIENEMRGLESDENVSKHELRLFMQHPMPCGHATGNLLTCDTSPSGCVICNQNDGQAAKADQPEPTEFTKAIRRWIELVDVKPGAVKKRFLEACKLIDRLTADQPEPVEFTSRIRDILNGKTDDVNDELQDEHALYESLDRIDRLTADLNKHGGHTVDCEIEYLGEDDYPGRTCTCGWSKIEKGLKKEGAE